MGVESAGIDGGYGVLDAVSNEEVLTKGAKRGRLVYLLRCRFFRSWNSRASTPHLVT